MASPCLLGFEMSLHWPGFGQAETASDRRSGKRVIRVRTWFNFGHRKRKKSYQSWNLAQLRTEEAEKEWLESEPGSTSDTKSRKRGFRVHTRPNFGQRDRKKRAQSPNRHHPNRIFLPNHTLSTIIKKRIDELSAHAR